MELEEELRVVGNNLKSLEVSEEKVYQTRCNSFDFKFSLKNSITRQLFNENLTAASREIG